MSAPPLPEKPGNDDNWVDRAGGLPRYIDRIARHLHEKGMDVGHAIASAVNTVKRWAAGGEHVHPDTVAKAQKALAEWEKKKAGSHLSLSAEVDDDALALAREFARHELNLAVRFDPSKHKRDFRGRFAKMLDDLDAGKHIELPGGTRVYKDTDGSFEIDQGPGIAPRYIRDPEHAADEALHSDPIAPGPMMEHADDMADIVKGDKLIEPNDADLMSQLDDDWYDQFDDAQLLRIARAYQRHGYVKDPVERALRRHHESKAKVDLSQPIDERRLAQARACLQLGIEFDESKHKRGGDGRFVKMLSALTTTLEQLPEGKLHKLPDGTSIRKGNGKDAYYEIYNAKKGSSKDPYVAERPWMKGPSDEIARDPEHAATKALMESARATKKDSIGGKQSHDLRNMAYNGGYDANHEKVKEALAGLVDIDGDGTPDAPKAAAEILTEHPNAQITPVKDLPADEQANWLDVAGPDAKLIQADDTGNRDYVASEKGLWRVDENGDLKPANASATKPDPSKKLDNQADADLQKEMDRQKAGGAKTVPGDDQGAAADEASKRGVEVPRRDQLRQKSLERKQTKAAGTVTDKQAFDAVTKAVDRLVEGDPEMFTGAADEIRDIHRSIKDPQYAADHGYEYEAETVLQEIADATEFSDHAEDKPLHAWATTKLKALQGGDGAGSSDPGFEAFKQELANTDPNSPQGKQLLDSYGAKIEGNEVIYAAGTSAEQRLPLDQGAGLDQQFGPLGNRDAAVQATQEWLQNEVDALKETAGDNPTDLAGELQSYLPDAGQIALDAISPGGEDLSPFGYEPVPGGLKLPDGTTIVIDKNGKVVVKEPGGGGQPPAV